MHSCCQVIRQDDPDQLTPHLFLSSLNTNEELKERERGDLRAHIYLPQKEWKKMLLRITRTMIIESQKIWTKRKWNDHLHYVVRQQLHVANHYTPFL